MILEIRGFYRTPDGSTFQFYKVTRSFNEEKLKGMSEDERYEYLDALADKEILQRVETTWEIVPDEASVSVR